MSTFESPPTLKILTIGPSGSGKSALLIRYCEDRFDDTSSTTIGVDLKTKNVSVHGKAYQLFLLDTAGQERFRTLSNSYYRNAHAIILMYDISNRDSFLSIDHWFDEVDANSVPGAVKYLAGCKKDKAALGLRCVSEEEGLAKSKARGAIGWCEVSSKNQENVRRVFAEVLEAVISDSELMKIGRRSRTGATNQIDVRNSGFVRRSAYNPTPMGPVCSC